MPVDLPSLPYSYQALEPYISATALKVHHDVLQRRYVQKLNGLTRATNLDHMPLEELIVRGEGEIYDNAAQVWNHTAFWQSMSPTGGGKPSRLSGFARSLSSFGPLDAVRHSIKAVAKGMFGSGWIWLVSDEQGYIHIWPGKDADNPMKYGYRPLLVIDLWEHAYFLDYKADRLRFIDAFLDHLVNWPFAEANYARAFGS